MFSLKDPADVRNANATNRKSQGKSTKVLRKNCSTTVTKPVGRKKKTDKSLNPTLNDVDEICCVFEPSNQRSTKNNAKDTKVHPDDCCCPECDKDDDSNEMNGA